MAQLLFFSAYVCFCLIAQQEAGMLKDTLIIYTTDNGGPIVPTTGAPDDAVGASNYPLRGGKHNPYEGGVKATAFFWDGRGVLHRRPPMPPTTIELARNLPIVTNFELATSAELPPENIGLR